MNERKSGFAALFGFFTDICTLPFEILFYGESHATNIISESIRKNKEIFDYAEHTGQDWRDVKYEDIPRWWRDRR